jgi:DNA mismatch repair protein MutH
MTEPNYDASSVESIVEFARQLTGLSLAEAVTLPDALISARSRGMLGNLVEEHYFGLRLNSEHRPDFPEAGLELKTTGVRPKKGAFVAKERLTLTMIDFESIINETWETSSLLLKCNLMLILFYLYEEEKPVFDRKFVLNPLLYKLLENDAEQLRSDWEAIRQKVIDKKAHELSEGDTVYLGAARKGSGGASEKLKSQPNSSLLAKGRAFSLKQGYLTKVIQGHIAGEGLIGVGKGQTLESATYERFRPYLGMTVEEISTTLGFFKSGPNHKSFNSNLAARILKAKNGTVFELEKAGIKMRTARLQPSGRPSEALSFPAFDYFEVLESEWEDSDFLGNLEQKYLFIVFQIDANGVQRLARTGYWNMPYEDRIRAKEVWEETKRRIRSGENDLPGMREHQIAHVRTHGRDSKDLVPTPFSGLQRKKSFWLNQGYLGDVLAAL